MIDREKVITHFNDAIEAYGNNSKWRFVRLDVLKDALELLKEQEPRVLTWEEVKKAELCWLEDRGYEPSATFEAYMWNPEKYGKSYRCWNRMPTDEQRKAVKWDG